MSSIPNPGPLSPIENKAHIQAHVALLCSSSPSRSAFAPSFPPFPARPLSTDPWLRPHTAGSGRTRSSTFSSPRRSSSLPSRSGTKRPTERPATLHRPAPGARGSFRRPQIRELTDLRGVQKAGLAMLVMYILQARVSLGAFIHWVKLPAFRPPQNYLHALLGLAIVGLASWQVHPRPRLCSA
ncbi:hypothetical protein GGX14DRAFT_567986 [Mycena pura]|uniref:Uncharacterized protein n=1 Tax=Mycena pura TaxID=153505 RepID=A0AAD6Y8B4_9AGAR|nr:hypothetical protein GGX14DRAFT_567986 [Mycena pura]